MGRTLANKKQKQNVAIFQNNTKFFGFSVVITRAKFYFFFNLVLCMWLWVKAKGSSFEWYNKAALLSWGPSFLKVNIVYECPRIESSTSCRALGNGKCWVYHMNPSMTGLLLWTVKSRPTFVSAFHIFFPNISSSQCLKIILQRCEWSVKRKK